MKNKRRSFKKIDFSKKNKEPLKPLFKKQALVIAVSVFLVVLITLTGSFAIFSKVSEGNEYNVVQVGELELSYVDLNDEGNVLQLADSYPISDSDGILATPYRFSVENTGTIIANYTVKIVDDEDTIEADGCSDNLLDSKYLRYKFDNEEVQDLSSKKDSTTGDYIITTGTLEPFESNIHEIRIWINESSPNSVLGTHYHGKVIIEVTQNNATDPYERPVPPPISEILALEDKVLASSSEFPRFYSSSSETNGRGIYKYTENGEDIYYWRGKVDEVEGAANHLLFAGICWEMVRTTNTGGLKIIYDGTPVEVDGVKTCPNTGSASQLTDLSKFNEKRNSPAYVGYMYGNTVYETITKSSTDEVLTTAGILYGYNIEWTGTEYKLKSKEGSSLFSSTGSWSTDKTNIANGNHYTCFDTDGSCEKVSYIFYTGSYPYYIELTGGVTVEKALEQMYSNEQSSTIKTNIETWFESTSLTTEDNLKKIEDIVYCNDRSVEEGNWGGWSIDENASTMMMSYSTTVRIQDNSTPSLDCRYITGNRDRFTYKDKVNGNGLLKWPVGLLTEDEMVLAGESNQVSTDSYLYTGQDYWSSSPSGFLMGSSYISRIISDGTLGSYTTDGSTGIRPVISLAAGIKFVEGGTGTVNNPYVVQ